MGRQELVGVVRVRPARLAGNAAAKEELGFTTVMLDNGYWYRIYNAQFDMALGDDTGIGCANPGIFELLLRLLQPGTRRFHRSAG